MSTYWGYVCESHDPPLISEHWINHGEGILIDTFRKERAGEWPDVPVVVGVNDALGSEPVPVVFYDSGYGSTAPIWWLRDHPRCAVALHNEYGDRRVIGDTVSGGIVHALTESTEEDAPLPKWTDLFGIDPDYTGGQDVNEWLDEQRGEA